MGLGRRKDHLRFRAANQGPGESWLFWGRLLFGFTDCEVDRKLACEYSWE